MSSSTVVTGNITLVAQWTANVYTVTFNPNGGSVSPATKSVTFDSTYGTLPTPTKTGNTFGGWFTAASGGEQRTATTKVATASNHTLYAHWTVNKYDLAITVGGGIDSVKYKVNGATSWSETKASVTLKVNYGSSYSLYGIPKPGYLGGDQKYLFNPNIGTESSPLTGTMGVAAVTKAFSSAQEPIFVKFDPNGGDALADNCRIPIVGYAYGCTRNIYPKASSDFGTLTSGVSVGSDGWIDVNADNSSGTGAMYKIHAPKPLPSVPAGCNFTALVEWGTTTGDAPDRLALGEYIQAQSKVSQLDSLHLTSFVSASNHNRASVARDESPTFLSHDNVSYAAGKIGTAKYRISIFGGRQKTSIYGDPLVARNWGFPTPTRTGHSFTGWFTAASGGTAVDANTKNTNTENHTLYAHWSANSYSVKIDYGHDGMTGSYSATYGAAFKVDAPTYVNYRFTGWTVSSGLNSSTAKWGTTSSPSAAISSSSTVCVNGATGSVWFKDITPNKDGAVTLKANWARITYDVTIQNNLKSSASYPTYGYKCYVTSANDSGFAEKTEDANGTLSFVAKSGCSYKMRLEYLEKAHVGSKFRVPVSVGGNALSRDGVTSDGRAVFSYVKSFGPDEAAKQSLAVSGVEMNCGGLSDPNSAATSSSDKTISFVNSTEVAVSVSAAQRTGVEFMRWTDVVPASALVSAADANPGVFRVPSGGVSITSSYEFKKFTVNAVVGPASLVKIGGSNSDWVECYQGTARPASASTSANVEYGKTVTFSLKKPSPSYGFAGWYDASGKLVSTDTTHTVSSATSGFTLYALFYAEVTISSHVKAESTSGIGCQLSINGSSTSSDSITEKVLLGSKSCKIEAVPTGGGIFVGWFNASDSQMSNPLPYVSSDTIQVDDTMSLVAYVSDASAVHYMAVYNTYVSGSSETIDSFLGYITVEGANVKTSNLDDFRTETKWPDAPGGGSYYKIIGTQGVKIRTSGKVSSKPYKRIREKIVGGDYSVIARDPDKEVLRAIVRDMVYSVDYGDVSVYTHKAVAVRNEDNETVGLVEVGGDYTGTSGARGEESQAKYEKDATVRFSAYPVNGYAFAGWFTAASGGTKASDNPVYEFPAEAAGKTLYARFVRESVALYKWEGSPLLKTAMWKSKVYEMSKPANLTSVRVDSTGYPLKRFASESYSSPDSKATSKVEFRDETAIRDQGTRRLPQKRPERFFQIEVANDAEVDAVTVSTNVGELAQ